MRIELEEEEVAQILAGWARTQFVPAAAPENEVKVTICANGNVHIVVDRKEVLS